ncbi:methylcobamide--CoM methyltransferase [Moorella sp. E308F]|uniref:uroporphyrinogen decarboxylase family protein n=1 Tax=unclassified Neomoorella TaxID=2676739 RepID=UPI0010FFB939|nr:MULTISPECIES: uroporphyrinogen decarboxylase family protein [unclassified Moorella (in: firmicutes)]GEA16023.1 methylcobamide--CoM methyltransferase [Moorella sp. E308F]GEA19134.1 methylcobamide--CoM methyltransferase [Moorella sp. E306M]
MGGFFNRDKIPFVPVVYEHAAALIGVTPSKMARSAELIVKGQLRAYELYGHDLVTVGIDIYNVEAEALGCPVQYFDDEAIPAIAGPIVSCPADLARLRVPDPEHDGRLPLLLDAASRVREVIGSEVAVGAAMVGPFTLAALLRGYENFILDLLTAPDFAGALLDFAAEVGLAVGTAMIKRGLSISINESWITPPLLSPELYQRFAFPREKGLIVALKAAGAASVGLISGGNTTPIVDWLVQTGSSILMADYGTDLVAYKAKARAAGIVLRGSIQARVVETGPKELIAAQAREVLAKGAPGGGFILGCGVVPYGAPPENVLYLKQVLAAYMAEHGGIA